MVSELHDVIFWTLLAILSLFPAVLKDLYIIKSAEHEIAPRWRFFGEALLLTPTQLNLIEETHGNKPERCLSAILEEFLKKNYECGIPSWKLIVVAIGCKQGGNNKDLA